MKIIACAFLYRDEPGDVCLIDLDKLRVTAPEIVKRIESQMAEEVPSLSSRNTSGIELSYEDCQSYAMQEAMVDPPQMVDAVVTVFVEQ